MNKTLLSLIVALLGGIHGSACAGAPTPLTLTLKSDHGLLPYKQDAEVLVRIDVRGGPALEARRLPVQLALVLDRSSSMSGEKIEQARQAAAYIVDQLGPKDQIALITYDSEVQVVVPMGPVGRKEALKAKIRAIQPRGMTALHGGVVEGAAQLRRVLHDQAVNRVILLSDGRANVGPQSPDELASLGRHLQREGIAVTTVGLGDDYNEDLMVGLANASRANYYYVRDVEKLPTIFGEELHFLQRLVARDIKIRIEIPEGLEAVEVVGHPELRPVGRFLECSLPELAAEQERHFLLKGKLTAQAKSEVRLVAAEATYMDREAHLQTSGSRVLTVATHRESSKVTGAVQKDIRAEYNRQQALEARDTAIKLADQGLVKEAVGRLRTMASLNRSQAKELKAPKLAEEADTLEAQAAQLESDGAFTSVSRKTMQYDNYQKQTQRR